MSRFVLAAGGTGGHLFPAQALAERLAAGGARVYLATDRRADAFTAAVPGVEILHVLAGRIGGGALHSARGLAETALGLVQALRLLHRLKPDAVIGFGGYPSVPTMLAATRLGLPTLLHEQNAVLGRANRLLARRVDRIATGFAETAGLPPAERARAVFTGNPVRPTIHAISEIPYHPPAPGEPVELLVLGGSQGARIFADVVPAALAALPAQLRGRLRAGVQARPEDCERVRVQLRDAGIAAEVRSFFDDIPQRLARTQLAVCRAGASTVAELAVAGRPAILVPYPFAADDHQAANACAFAGSGGGWAVPQSELSAALLAALLVQRLCDPHGLAAAATAARSGAGDAAERLAAAVRDLAAQAGQRERAA